MAISVGDRIPDVELMTMTDGGPQRVRSGEVLGEGRVVLFAVPGAFTPTCSDHHLPGFVLRAEDIKAKGVDTIACLAVNDAFVMGAWGRAQGTDGKVTMLADGNGEFTAEVGLELDGSGFGLGTRSQRYAAVLEGGVVRELFVERG
ncbi:MAG: peroxiredoxin, partial [Acidimicrobiia bacterium]